MGKIVFCEENKKYYRIIYSNVYAYLRKRECHLYRSLNKAVKDNDTQLVKSIRRQLKETKRKMYKGVIYKEISVGNVPDNAKIATQRHVPDKSKYHIICLALKK